MKFLKSKKKEISMILLCFMIMAIICLLLYKPMIEIFKNPQALQTQLQSYGVLGQILFIGIMALQVIFVFLPGEIVEIMAGFLYGPLGGMIACMIGCAIGSSLIYVFVKKYGVKFIDKLIGLDKVNEVDFLKNKEKRNILCFIIFFIPGTPKDILTYFIPLTDMKLSTFLFITTIARFPSIITSTLGGHAIGMKNYLFSVIIFAITGLISIGGLYIYKKMTEKKSIHYNL